MEPQFYKGNRDAFMEKLAPGSLALFFSGVPVRKQRTRIMPILRTAILSI